MNQANYNSKIKYSQNEPIEFPDFNLTFVGKRTVAPGPDFPNQNLAFVYYDFEINNGTEKKTISWSSGIGAIAPHPFEIGKNQLYLIKTFFDDPENPGKVIKLEEDELIIKKDL